MKDRRHMPKLPRRGHVFVSLTVRDENGFLHHFGDMETVAGAVHEAVAIMQLESVSTAGAHREAMTG